MAFLWEQKHWPEMTWDSASLSTLLATVAHEQGRLRGKMERLGFKLQGDAYLQTLTEDVIKSSEIEGQFLKADQVRSSIARRLGMDIGGLTPVDRNVEGTVEMMLDATTNYDSPLTLERLLSWHTALFPTGRSGMTTILVGKWRDDRDGPMQVVSGPMGRERVHFQGPPAVRVPREMTTFLEWLTKSHGEHPLLTAGIAHFWFVTIHPFDDGNGRIARAIADLMLARSEKTSQRFYSMSSQIRRERNEYYDILEKSQKAGLDITEWLVWFLSCLHRAILNSGEILDRVMTKARFWERFNQQPLNDRQIKVLNSLIDGFEGKLTSSKWSKIAKCSQDTATRDIKDLIRRGALKQEPGGGRSTSFSLLLEGRNLSDH